MASKKSATNWKSLRHAHGPATRVPEQVKALANTNAYARDEAYVTLANTLVGENAWFTASAPAVALLLDSLEGAFEPHRILLLVADILGANHIRAWKVGVNAAIGSDAAAAREQAVARKTQLLQAVENPSPAIRNSAALVLSLLYPELPDEVLPRLRARAEQDPVDVVRANALLSLACTNADVAQALLPNARQSEHAVVRGAAAIVALRLDDRRAWSGEASCLTDFLTWKPQRRKEQLPWEFDDPDAQPAWFAIFMNAYLYRDLPFADHAPKALIALGERREEAPTGTLAEFLIDLATSHPGMVETQVVKVLLALGGFPNVLSEDRVMRLEELSPSQRALAERLATTSLLPRASFGLPASGRCRARWIGLEPPGPLDQIVDAQIGKNSARLPLWEALVRMLGYYGDPFPDQLRSQPTGLNRWEAAVQHLAFSYMGGGLLSPEATERELAVVNEPGFFERAEQVGNDLAKRFDAANRSGVGFAVPVQVASLLLLPFVRANRPIPDHWDSLICVGKDPRALEILNGLPPERCVRVFAKYLESGEAKEGPDRAGNVIELIHMAPSRRIAELVLEKAAPWQRTAPEAYDITLRILAELAEKHPELRVT